MRQTLSQQIGRIAPSAQHLIGLDLRQLPQPSPPRSGSPKCRHTGHAPKRHRPTAAPPPCRRHISGNGSRGLDDTVGLAAVGNQASHAMPTRRVPGTTCKSVWATAYVFLGGAPPVPKPSTACAGAQQCQPVRMETGSERKPTARDRSARDRCSARSHVLISRRTVADDEGIARLLRTTPDRHRLATAGFRFAWRSARPARVARRERCSSVPQASDSAYYARAPRAPRE
jgi:hypothetical protein